MSEHEEALLRNHFHLDPGWAHALAPVADQLTAMIDILSKQGAYLPDGTRILRAFHYPFEQVKVLIAGQDPYPTPGHAVGLSFSVESDVSPIPKSLKNIFTEYTEDLGLPTPTTGDLSPWCRQGVCLLNRTLTVAPHSPASHRGIGWEAITEQAVRALAARQQPLVAILWGAQARELVPMLGEDTAVITSTHPSPLSAYRGFFGSRPFSRANTLLTNRSVDPINWALP